jgi:hypothetical protein
VAEVAVQPTWLWDFRAAGSGRGERFPGAGVGIEQPAELSGFKRGGAVVGGTSFQCIQPSIDLWQTADYDYGGVLEALQHGLKHFGRRRAEDDIGPGAVPVVILILIENQAVAASEGVREGIREKALEAEEGGFIFMVRFV